VIAKHLTIEETFRLKEKFKLMDNKQ